MSERVERKLLEILDRPTQSPYGNPIPGLEELGQVSQEEAFLGEGLRQLTELVGTEVSQVVVRRIGEPAQADPEVLNLLDAAGLHPGRAAGVRGDASHVFILGDEGEVAVPWQIAEHVFVTTQ